MEKKTVYTCAICGKDYKSIDGRIKCETTCFEKQKEIAAKAEKEQKKKEQEVRRQKVVAAIRNASDELEAYIDDYGSFSYSSADDMADTAQEETTEKTVSKSETTSDEIWPFNNWPFASKLWHHFW